jgi:hypothetical protein
MTLTKALASLRISRKGEQEARMLVFVSAGSLMTGRVTTGVEGRE